MQCSSSASGWALINRFDKSVSSAARPARALGAHNLACDNGTAVVLHGLAGESGGSMQSSATCFWHLKHLVQDCPGNCAHEEQFGANLLRQMASLLIMHLRCSSNLLPRHTLATTRLATLYCKAIGTGARSGPSAWVSCPADSYPCQWLVRTTTAAWKIGALDLYPGTGVRCLPKKTCVLLESRILGSISECARP